MRVAGLHLLLLRHLLRRLRREAVLHERLALVARLAGGLRVACLHLVLLAVCGESRRCQHAADEQRGHQRSDLHWTLPVGGLHVVR
ncbi:hypothetical protein DM52_2876 [Burkholderia mallei]|nr:hypothetical protein DM52_2876 [Burkholderia mallei]